MINMSELGRNIRQAIRRASRNKDYSIEFGEITPILLQEVKSLIERLQTPEYIDFIRTYSWSDRMTDGKLKEVIDNLLSQLKELDDNKSLLVSELGKRVIEGTTENPSKTISDEYEMGSDNVEIWFKTNSLKVYQDFLNGKIRPLLQVYVFFAEQGLEDKYKEIIKRVNTNPYIKDLVNIIGNKGNIEDAARSNEGQPPKVLNELINDSLDDEKLKLVYNMLGGGETTTTQYDIIFNMGQLKNPVTLGDLKNLETFINVIYSVNSILINKSPTIKIIRDTLPANLFSKFLNTIVSVKDGTQFMLAFVNMIGRRGDKGGSGKFRLGTSDMYPESKLLRDFYDDLKSKGELEEVVVDGEYKPIGYKRWKDTQFETGGVTEKFNRFVSSGEQPKIPGKKNKNLVLLPYYDISEDNMDNPSFSVDVEPEYILPSLIGFIKLFNPSFVIDDRPPFTEMEDYSVEEQKLEADLLKYKNIIIVGFEKIVSDLINYMVNTASTVQYLKVKFENEEMDAITFLDEIEAIEVKNNV